MLAVLQERLGEEPRPCHGGGQREYPLIRLHRELLGYREDPFKELPPDGDPPGSQEGLVLDERHDVRRGHEPHLVRAREDGFVLLLSSEPHDAPVPDCAEVLI